MLTAGWGRSAQGNLRIRCARQAGHRKVANDNRFARDGAPSTPALGCVILAPTITQVGLQYANRVDFDPIRERSSP